MATTSNGQDFIKACEEVILVTTCGAEDLNSNVSAWDARTGNLLQTFSAGSANPNTLCILEDECLIAASLSKPIIHVWNMLRQGKKHSKVICSGRLSCLALTLDSVFLVAGIEDKIHIWQTDNGNLYNVLSYSSVEVKKLKVCPRGQYLVGAFKDGSLAVWELQEVLHRDPMRVVAHRPFNVFLNHAGQVTDFHISLTNKVASASMDFTVRIWDLLYKEQRKMFELGAPVTSVIQDNCELTVYAGDINGNVYAIDLNYQPAEQEVHIDPQNNHNGFTFHKAHDAAIRCMALTRDQSKLVTGSDDKTVKVWTMMSPVTTLVITVNERVGNLLVVPTPQSLRFPDRKPQAMLATLKRHVHRTQPEDVDNSLIHVDIKGVDKVCCSKRNMDSEILETYKQKANKLKKANDEIYEFALKEIIK